MALDLIEELRAPYVDRFVLSLVNRRQVKASDFVSCEDGGVILSDDARKNVLGLWQKRKQESSPIRSLRRRLPLVGAISFKRNFSLGSCVGI